MKRFLHKLTRRSVGIGVPAIFASEHKYWQYLHFLCFVVIKAWSPGRNWRSSKVERDGLFLLKRSFAVLLRCIVGSSGVAVCVPVGTADSLSWAQWMRELMNAMRNYLWLLIPSLTSGCPYAVSLYKTYEFTLTISALCRKRSIHVRRQQILGW